MTCLTPKGAEFKKKKYELYPAEVYTNREHRYRYMSDERNPDDKETNMVHFERWGSFGEGNSSSPTYHHRRKSRRKTKNLLLGLLLSFHLGLLINALVNGPILDLRRRFCFPLASR